MQSQHIEIQLQNKGGSHDTWHFKKKCNKKNQDNQVLKNGASRICRITKKNTATSNPC